MKTPILAFLCALSTAFLASGQVPSLINYQGRLTDANGAAVTGSKNFAISIFDSSTGGNLLYSETIGAVTLDSNGVYSFQFGSAGTSNKQVTEAIGTTDGTTLVYSKAMANSSVVNNSITVTDGTNSWSQSVGNPGVGASATANTIVGFVIGATITNGGSGYTSAPTVTISGNGTGATATATLTDGVVTGINIVSAGSGYTTGATITITPPVIPFRVEYASGTITATYASVPTVGQTIAATYRYGTGGIADTLGNAGEHWMAITVDGVIQGARQRVLAVPFASQAATSAVAKTLNPQTSSWRPEIFATVSGSWQNGGPKGATATPFGPGYWGSWTAECTIPNSFLSLSGLSTSYWINQVYGDLSSQLGITIQIIELKSDYNESVIFQDSMQKLAGQPYPGRQIKNSSMNIELNQSSYYKLRVEVSNNNNSIGIYGIKLSGLTSVAK